MAYRGTVDGFCQLYSQLRWEIRGDDSQSEAWGPQTSGPALAAIRVLGSGIFDNSEISEAPGSMGDCEADEDEDDGDDDDGGGDDNSADVDYHDVYNDEGSPDIDFTPPTPTLTPQQELMLTEYAEMLVDSLTTLILTKWPHAPADATFLLLRTFIREVVLRAGASYLLVVSAAYYLALCPPEKLSGLTGLQIFVTALRCSHRFWYDRTCRLASWSLICGVSSDDLRRFDHMLLTGTDYRLNFPRRRFNKWVDFLLQYAPAGICDLNSKPAARREFQRRIAVFQQRIHQVRADLGNLAELGAWPFRPNRFQAMIWAKKYPDTTMFTQDDPWATPIYTYLVDVRCPAAARVLCETRGNLCAGPKLVPTMRLPQSEPLGSTLTLAWPSCGLLDGSVEAWLGSVQTPSDVCVDEQWCDGERDVWGRPDEDGACLREKPRLSLCAMATARVENRLPRLRDMIPSHILYQTRPSAGFDDGLDPGPVENLSCRWPTTHPSLARSHSASSGSTGLTPFDTVWDMSSPSQCRSQTSMSSLLATSTYCQTRSPNQLLLRGTKRAHDDHAPTPAAVLCAPAATALHAQDTDQLVAGPGLAPRARSSVAFMLNPSSPCMAAHFDTLLAREHETGWTWIPVSPASCRPHIKMAHRPSCPHAGRVVRLPPLQTRPSQPCHQHSRDALVGRLPLTVEAMCGRRAKRVRGPPRRLHCGQQDQASAAGVYQQQLWDGAVLAH